MTQKPVNDKADKLKQLIGRHKNEVLTKLTETCQLNEENELVKRELER